MNNQFEILEKKRSFLAKKPVTADEITRCEKELGLKFASDYREYLRRYGEVIYYGHELTGIIPSKRLNVVYVTQEMWEFNPKVPRNYYVIEETNIDGIVIWQNETGKVFQSSPNAGLTKIADSLLEYISNH